MQKDFILSHVDHTMLKQGATWADIQRICDEGLSHKTASVCIPPSYVADAAAYLKEGAFGSLYRHWLSQWVSDHSGESGRNKRCHRKGRR